MTQFKVTLNDYVGTHFTLGEDATPEELADRFSEWLDSDTETITLQGANKFVVLPKNRVLFFEIER